MEPLYCGHLGDLVKCLVYSGAPLLWTPWGPGEVPCIDRCPHFRGKFVPRKHVWDTGKSLIQRCPYSRSVLLRGGSQYNFHLIRLTSSPPLPSPPLPSPPLPSPPRKRELASLCEGHHQAKISVSTQLPTTTHFI